jgi:choline kinase
MKAGLIAAGLGERLRDAGIRVPKPLVEIAGTPLIDHVLDAVAAAGIPEVACIFNEAADTDAVAAHCRVRRRAPRLHIVRRTTPSSMESLFTLAPLLCDGPALVLTVDAVFAPAMLGEFLAAAARYADAERRAAVTGFDDEKPLRVTLDMACQVVALGEDAAASGLVTAGFYVFAPRVFCRDRRRADARLSALRQYLGHLLRGGYRVYGAHVGKTVDVDRPKDIAAADARTRRLHIVTPDFLGVARERRYSPGKVDDDRAILDAVATRLAGTYRVRVVSADAPLSDVAPPTLVFAMCQGPAALESLRRWEAAGVRVVNSAAAIENTHRSRMLAAFERQGVPHPPSRLPRTDAPAELPEWFEAGASLKRGDVHATDPDDVVRVDSGAAARSALETMRRRGIANALVQRHVEGEVFKFYAVRGRFFACFPPPDASRVLAPAEEMAMNELAEVGAAALDLEVFGGDCVRDRQMGLWIIDLNDWPSYARCRSGASEAIASYLTAQTGTT